MARQAERAARLLDAMQQRVNRLEETVGRDDGLPNQLETVTDLANGQETVSQTTTAVDYLTWDDDTEAWDSQQWGR